MSGLLLASEPVLTVLGLWCLAAATLVPLLGLVLRRGGEGLPPPVDDDQVVELAAIEERLRLALDHRTEEGMALNYQPVIDLRSGRVTSAEALLRWRHPRLGALAPMRVVEVAREAAMLQTLGTWVLQTACAQVVRWIGDEAAPSRVSVNVDAAELADDELPATVARVLETTGLPPERLELEVTESAALDDLAHTGRVLGRIHDLGVTVSLDDFGTGHSSLAYLRTLPVQRLKLDRAFVSELGTDDRSRAIVTAVIDLAHRLDLRVTAEGVETASQAALLVELGCDEAQGFLFSPALPAPEMVELIPAIESVLGRSLVAG